MRFHDRDTLARKAVQVLLRHGKPMSPCDISDALDALKIGSKADDRVGTVKRALQTAVDDPLEFTPLVRESDGTYSLARQNEWSNGYMNHGFFPSSVDEHGDQISQRALQELYDSHEKERLNEIRKSVDTLLSWALTEGVLTGQVQVDRLLNLSWQRGVLDSLFDQYQGLSLISLVPHVCRAMHKQESENFAANPMYVWSDRLNFMVGAEVDTTALVALRQQDEPTFRATLKETLLRLGAKDLVEVWNNPTIKFRGTLAGSKIAVGAYQGFAALDQAEVQQLRGALNAGEQGLLLNSGPVSAEAAEEGKRNGVALVMTHDGRDLLQTVASSLSGPVLPVIGSL